MHFVARHFINRIVSWNNARYSQEYSHNLTLSLLTEEVQELADAHEPVDKLDALVDIIYVAIGAIWKLGLGPYAIEEAIHIVCDSNDSKTATKTDPNVKANINKGSEFITPEPRLFALLLNAKKKPTLNSAPVPTCFPNTKITLVDSSILDQPIPTKEQSFVKHDQDKLKYTLIPTEVTKGLAQVLTFGETKYSANNWKKVDDSKRYLDALYRHLEAWRSGELLDKESGFSHMKHVLTNAAFLTYFEENEE